MSFINFHCSPSFSNRLKASLPVFALAFLGAMPVSADQLTRSIDVNGTPAQVWAMIGPFCAIEQWHPAIGACTKAGSNPLTRTLVTKDGKATFVEAQTMRDDKAHLYSYTFISSPLPVTHYHATLAVAAKSYGVSTVTWSGNYTPDDGKAKDAMDALSGIYQSGLEAIKAKLAQ